MKRNRLRALSAAVCMAMAFTAVGCAGPSTRVLPRENGNFYEPAEDESPVLEEANPYYMQEELEILTTAGRSSGSRGEGSAARYMEQLLTDYGYEVRRQRFRYAKADASFLTGTNVEAVRKTPVPDADILIVTTNHDAPAGSPGACDNASGVVTWLETARLISKLPTDTEVRFVSVSGTDEGRLGARHYLDSLTAKERARVIGAIELAAPGGAAGYPMILGTPDGKATMLGDMVKEACWDVLGELWQYEAVQQKNYLAFTGGQIPSLCLTQARTSYEAGTPLDLPNTVDIERTAQAVNVLARTVSKIMSTDTPSLLAKSRFMNDLRDDAYLRMQDEELGFGESHQQTERRLGIEGRKRSVNTDRQGRSMEGYEYRMKWFDVDQQLLTGYYYVENQLDTVSIDGDGAGVTLEEMKERLSAWYGAVDAESEGPSGTQLEWKSERHRVQARLIPETEGYEVELRAYEPEPEQLGELVWNGSTGTLEASETERAAEPGETAFLQRVKPLAEKLTAIYPKEFLEAVGRIRIYTDGIGGTKQYLRNPDETWEMGIDLEDMVKPDGSWREETEAEKRLVSLYGTFLEKRNPDGIADAFAEQFLSEGGEMLRVQTGVKPGETTEAKPKPLDFADSFAMFVLAEQPAQAETEWCRRVSFFYESEMMLAYRSQIRQQLHLQTVWNPDGLTE